MPEDVDQARVPLLDLSGRIERRWEELRSASERVMKSGRFILGPEVEAFEEEVGDYLGVEHAVGVNSGTDALVIGLRSLGVGPGDEVITTPFTFFATPESISIVGARPVFVDIEPESFNLDPERVEAAITNETAAIVPVHLFGGPANMDALSDIAARHDVPLLEDCAQSYGAVYGGRRTGAIGAAGAFSFFPSKNLGGFGDGGLLATNDADVAKTSRMLRAHGGKDKYHNVMLGYNSRLDALQAAILRVHQRYIDQDNAGRREAAARYGELLADAPGLTVPEPTSGHVFHQYTVRIHDDRRDRVVRRLDDHGIASKVYYPVPCHRLPVYAAMDVSLPEAEKASDEVLSLPMWPEIDCAAQERVAKVLRGALT